MKKTPDKRASIMTDNLGAAGAALVLTCALAANALGQTAINSGTSFPNSGTISGDVTINPGGQLINGGTVTGAVVNTSSGLSSGPFVVTPPGLSNSGTIGGGVLNNPGGVVTNSSGGTISGSNGFSNAGQLTNDGTISGGVTNNAGGAIANNGTVNGGLTNNSQATATNNAGGTINGLVNANSGGLLTNNGTISNGVGNTGQLDNNGTVNGGMTNNAGGVVTNNLGGQITASGTSGGLVNNSGGTISNSGAIALAFNAGGVTNNSGGQVGFVTNVAGGVVTNNGGGTIGGINNLGTVNNASGGTISSSAIAVDNSSIFGNSGSISGAATGVVNNSNGQFTNNGTIASTGGVGVLNFANATFTNNAGGTVGGAGAGLTNNAGGTVTNNGTINDGVINSGGFSNGSTGLIADGFTNAGQLTNSGTINNGVTNNGAIVVNNLGGTINGGVTNSGSFSNNGLIVGPVSGSGGAFTNNTSGTINGSVNVQGQFTNSGLIMGNVSGPDGAVFTNTSSGTIDGNVTSSGSFTNSGTVNGSISINPAPLPEAEFSVGVANTGSGRINGNVVSSRAFTNNGVVTGSFTNNPDGILSGTGTVGSLDTAGVVAPGNSIGVLTVDGNLIHRRGAYQVELDGTGRSDLIRVGGTASLQVGTVSVTAQPGAGYAPRTTYRIVTAAGGVSGRYGALSDPYPFLQPSLTYDANNVYLTLQMGGFAAAAGNASEQAVGRVLDVAVDAASGDFAQVLSAMATSTLSPAQAQAALTALSGQNYSTFASTMVQGAQLFLNSFANQAGGGAPAGTRTSLAEACDVACDVTAPAWGAWGGALGGLGTIGASTGTGAVTYNVGGFAAGLDRMVAPGLRVGVTTGYTTGTQWTQGFGGQGMTSTVLAGLYGSYRQDRVYVDAVAGYAYSYNQMWRQILLPGVGARTAQGGTGANQWYGQIEGGYRVDLGTAADASVTPFLRLQGYTGTQNGFTESGAQSLNLTVAGQTTNSLRSVLGAQLAAALDLGWREKLGLRFRVGWSHEYADTARPVTAALAGAPLLPFTTYGIAPQRDAAVVGFSASAAVADGALLYLRYEGDISAQDNAHALTAGVRMVW